MKYFEMRALGTGRVEIDLFGEITPFSFGDADKSAVDFRNELKEQGNVSEIVLNVNSPGGSVFEGNAIYNTLKFHPAKVTANVMAVAASIASVIIMAADEINIAPNAAVMIHEPFSFIGGTAAEMRKQADLLDSIRATAVDAYAERTKSSAKEIRDMIAAETWLFAEEAVAKGFADNILAVEETEDEFAMYGTGAKEVLMRYEKLPESIKAMVEAAENRQPEMTTDVVVEDEPAGEGSEEAPAPSGSPAPAPTSVKEPTQKMDKETLMSEHADVANSLREDALKDERERVSGIRDSALPGSEELVDESIKNGATLTEFLMKQTKAEQGRLQALNEAQNNAADSDPVGAGQVSDEEEVTAERPTVDNKFLTDVYARRNSK